MLSAMKYDFYESFTDGSGEHKLTKQQIKRLFTQSELKEMVATGQVVIRKTCQYWAEEAVDYSRGVSVL